MRRMSVYVALLATATGLLPSGPALAGGGLVMANGQFPTAVATPAPYSDGAEMLIPVQDGGPDFWQVTGVASNDTLNIRSGAGTLNRVVARAPNGTVLRNLGCSGSGSSRWCEVETRDGKIRGWVKGSFLKEYGGGSGGSSADVPEIYVRNSGDIEVRWSSGCTMLYNSRGNRVQSGGSCSRSQRNRSDDAVDRHMREQGGSMAEGGGGPVDMKGLGRVTQGGLLVARITSKNGRSYALILTGSQDGLTCTGSFDEAPGGRNAISTIIHCTNGDTGSAILKGETLTFSAGRKGGYAKF